MMRAQEEDVKNLLTESIRKGGNGNLPPVAEKNLFLKKMTRITHHICATTAHCNATFSVFTQDVNVLSYSPLYLPMPRFVLYIFPCLAPVHRKAS